MKIIIPGNPIPKARARHARRGSFISTYDPQQKEKLTTQMLMTSEILHIHPEMPFLDRIIVHMEFYMPIPNSLSKRKKQAKLSNPQTHIVKPDLSNLIKFYEDAANGILWKDDAQIVILEASKEYSDNPRTEIEIHEFPVDETKNIT